MMQEFLSKQFMLGDEKNNYSKEEAEKILKKYPDRIPVIVNKSRSAKNDTPDLDKHKYLVPSDLTLGQFQYVIRKRLALHPSKALFLFAENTAIPTSELMASVYNDYHDNETKFLFVSYSLENTFG